MCDNAHMQISFIGDEQIAQWSLSDNAAQLSGLYHQLVDFRIAMAFLPLASPNSKCLGTICYYELAWQLPIAHGRRRGRRRQMALASRRPLRFITPQAHRPNDGENPN